MKLPIYLDHHATTALDPEVLREMLPYFTEVFGNPASRHYEQGWKAEAAVENSLGIIAAALGAQPSEVFFTSGATESNNIAIQGVVKAYASKGKHIVISDVEHKSVYGQVETLVSREQIELTVIPVDEFGVIDLQKLEAAIRPDTILVSVMAANNEIGTIQPIEKISRICRRHQTLFHVDAVQLFGKAPIDVEKMGIDLLSVSAHKIYGPKGVGALYVRRKNPRVVLQSLILGGSQERGVRAGTLNVPAIVGFGKAIELALKNQKNENEVLASLRNRLFSKLEKALEGVFLNGPSLSGLDRLSHNLNIGFDGVSGAVLMTTVREIAFSTGSACSSENPEPSHVLKAIGLSDECALSSIRLGLGRYTTEDEIDFAAEKLIEKVKQLRELSPNYSSRKIQKQNEVHCP